MAKKIKDTNEPSDKTEVPYTEDIYAPKDDIYNQAKEEKLADDEAPLDDHSPAQGLDIPGTELDDEMEDIGEEDEENNYYSLGGDNHEDLEEDA